MNLDDPKLTAYALDEFDALDADQRVEVEAWLATSPEGRQFVAETRQIAALLSEKLHTTCTPTLTEEQREAILGGTSASPKKSNFPIPSHTGALASTAPRAPSKIRKVSFITALAALAACLLAGPFLPWTQILGLRHEGDAKVAAVGSLENKKSSETFHVTMEATPAPPPASASAAPNPIQLDGKDVQLALSASAANQRLAAAPAKIAFESSPAALAALQPAAQPTSAPMIASASGFSSVPPSGGNLKSKRRELSQSMARIGPVARGSDDSDTSELMRRSGAEKEFNTEAYDSLEENPFLDVKRNPLSTFSIDVDTASYANIRRFINQGQLPPKGAVRIEEMLNYFSYNYPAPTDNTPFSTSIEAAECPWQPDHRLVRIGLRGRDVPVTERPAGNLVFLIDISGSMDQPNKLPLLKQSLRMLVDQLGENDRVAIAVYAGQSGLALPSTSDKQAIKDSLDHLQPGGSTNGASGIITAYDEARKNFIKGGVNRVILATDGDFNVGITSQSDLVDLIKEKAKTGVFLSVLGFGDGNLKDSTMEKLADKGNGNYAYIDRVSEGRKVLVEQLGGTLVTIAKDVKIQVEFNPAVVAQYRLIGYENRVLTKEDFNDDKKDAGEIGANHTVTALYEVVPVGKSVPVSTVDALKYQTAPASDQSKIENSKANTSEMLTVKLRYKQPDSDTSTKVEFPFIDQAEKLTSATPDFRFAAAVAEIGLLLKGSAHKQLASWDSAIELASQSLNDLEKKRDDQYRAEFIDMARKARDMSRRLD